MKDDFITETISESLKILLLSRSERIGRVVEVICQELNLDLEIVSTEPRSLDAFYKRIQPAQTWYRILWWDELGQGSTEYLPDLINWLRKRKELQGCVIPTPLEGDLLATSNGLQDLTTQAQRAFQLIEQRSPYISCFFYKDLLDEQLSSSLVPEIGAYLQSKRYFPDTSFQLISLSSFAKEVVSQLVIPRGGQRKLIQGSQQVSIIELIREFRKEMPGLLPKSFEQSSKNLLKIVGSPRKIETVSGFNSDQRTQILVERLKDYLQYKPEVKALTRSPHLPAPSVRKAVAKSVATIPKPAAPTLPIDRGEEPQVVEPPKVRIKTTPKQQVIPEKPRVIQPVAHQVRPNLVQASVLTHVAKQVLIPQVAPPDIRRSKIVLESIFSSALQKRPLVIDQVKHAQSRESRTVIQREIHQNFKPEVEQHIDKQISALFANALPEAPTTSVVAKRFEPIISKTTKKQPKKNRNIFSNKVVKVFIVLLVLVSIGWGSFMGNQWLIVKTFASVEDSISKGKEVSTFTKLSGTFSAATLPYQVQVFQPIISSSKATELRSLSQSLTHLLPLQESLLQTQQNIYSAIHQVFAKSSESSLATFEKLPTQVEESYKQLGNAEAELKALQSQEFLAPSQHEKISETISSISKIKKNLLITQQLSTFAPMILGAETPQTYLVLLQDNQELRATGGFIQSVALVTFKDGKLVDTKVYPSAYIDKELEGVVAPPSDLQEYLGEEKWFFHDANWSGDFKESSLKATLFVEKSLSVEIDGVIGLNWLSIQELLKVTGEVPVESFQEKLTAENIHERVRAHARETVTAETTGFSDDALKEVLNKFFGVQEEKVPTALASLSQVFETTESTVYFKNPQLQQVIETFGWSGSVITPPCPGQFAQDECVVSSVYQVDSNVGVNKVNYFVKKKTDAQIELDQQKNYIKLYTTYENHSLIDQWPQGAYKNYVRYYFKPGVENIEMKINGESVSKENIFEEISTSQHVVGVLINVPSQERVIVEVSYEERGVASPMSYAFFWQKQPGVSSTPLNLKVSYPKAYVPTLVAPEANISSNAVEFNFVGNQHTFAGIRFK